MSFKVGELSKYSRVDPEKSHLIRDVIDEYGLASSEVILDISKSYSLDFHVSEKRHISEDLNKSCLKSPFPVGEPVKYCPKCGRKYPKSEVICFDCLVHLKDISDSLSVDDIECDFKLVFKAKNDFTEFEDILCSDNLEKIRLFNFTFADFEDILRDIKSQAFMNFDTLIKDNGLDFDTLEIRDKILLFAKSFIKIRYKSYGQNLGYFEGDAIYIDDRQVKSFQITTILHELSHFLLHEILAFVICRILDSNKNTIIDDLVTFILYYSPFTQLIDEYCAHDVEGRFTVFGFQDYSSYLQIEDGLKEEMSADEIEITKSIANTFATHIKDIFESLIDNELRQEIKDQFLSDVLDRPDYNALKMENCQILNDEGFIRAIWLILYEGCVEASNNINRLKE